MSGNTAFAILMIDAFLLLFRIWALIACASRPRWMFEAAHKSKTLWTVVLFVCLFLPFLGFFVALWYLFSTDRAVRNQGQIGRIGFPGGPPQY
jgi:O-antigen ligase